MFSRRSFNQFQLSNRKLSRRSYTPLNQIDLATALNRVNDFHYRGDVISGWSVGSVPNGGYLMMMAIKAAINCTAEHIDPLSVTAYYVSRGFENVPADIKIRIITKTRSSTTLHITMSQAGDIKSEYLAVFGNLDKFQGFSFNNKQSLKSPLPPLSECIDCSDIFRTREQHVTYFPKMKIVLPSNEPFLTGFLQGKTGDKASLNCYTRLNDNKIPCLPSMAFFLDALSPPILNLRRSKWIPTMEYTVNFWSKPKISNPIEDDDYWVQERLETLFSKNGILHIDSEIWSADGKTLLATSRQMARLMEMKDKSATPSSTSS